MLNNIFLKSLIVFCVLLTKVSTAQELNFSVTVQAPNLITTDPRVIRTMEKEVEEFLNTTKWTSDDYLEEERIEGNLLITITGESGSNNFTADFTFQSIRTVFNSTYKTEMLNYRDKSNSFTYLENQAIINSKEKYFDNLSTILTFYAYVVLALDYDSFSMLGGEEYFSIAYNISQSLPSNILNVGNWSKTSNKRSRYWLMENVKSPRLKSVRESMYTYHRRGLDIMYEEPAKGRAIILSTLKSLDKANDLYPNSMMMQMFSDTKNKEVIEIYLAAERADKLKVYDIMVGVDPYRANIYNVLKK